MSIENSRYIFIRDLMAVLWECCEYGLNWIHVRGMRNIGNINAEAAED